jgi:hypothetical protein
LGQEQQQREDLGQDSPEGQQLEEEGKDCNTPRSHCDDRNQTEASSYNERDPKVLDHKPSPGSGSDSRSQRRPPPFHRRHPRLQIRIVNNWKGKLSRAIFVRHSLDHRYRFFSDSMFQFLFDEERVIRERKKRP